MQTDLTPARKATESFDEYKTRRAMGNAEVKAHLKGSYLYSFEDKQNVRYNPMLDVTSGIPYRKPTNH